MNPLDFNGFEAIHRVIGPGFTIVTGNDIDTAK
jgi:hypothetical protein